MPEETEIMQTPSAPAPATAPVKPVQSPVFTTLTSNVALLPLDDIDTDQIIPARYLKTTEKAGLAPHLFADWRYHADGSPKLDFALLLPEAEGAKILLAG